MFLRELTDPVSTIPGVGKVSSATLAASGIRTVAHLLERLPRSYDDRKSKVTLTESAAGGRANTIVKVLGHDYFGRGRNSTLKVTVEDSTARASLVCFGRNFLRSALLPGKQYFLTGQFL